MAGRTLRWTLKAEDELLEILAYYRVRNDNSEYGDKLVLKFHERMGYVVANPYSGQPAPKKGFRYVIVYPFQLFYYVAKKEVVVASVWDARRNPDTLKLTR